MDLFAAAGIDPGDPGAGGARSGRPAAPRSLRVPLFNHKVVEEARNRAVFSPTEAQRKAAADYARKARSPRFAQQSEMAVRDIFVNDVLVTILGYKPYDPDSLHSLSREYAIRRGNVDVALGYFSGPEDKGELVAPCELKGPGTRDLDAIAPGRGRSPVQQAWDYAMDVAGARWVLVSNCLELRLYGFGRGRDAYEVFDLTKLDEEEEHGRLWLILAADRFLGEATEALLRDTDSAYRRITDDLYREYHDLRNKLIGFLVDSADGPKLSLADAIGLAQKLLDRILFIAFAQGTGLLQKGLLEQAASERSTWTPQPLWSNFQSLFRYVDRGEPRLYILAYNGGLFAPDPAADGLLLPDHLAEEVARLGQWDYRSEVPVTVLGHIFEQSVTDIERMRAEAQGLPPPPVAKRKREGVVYTPDIVTRFLVERTVGLTLKERRAALLESHGKDPAALDNGELIFAPGEEATELAFWRDYAAALRALRIVDPACGSGAFLVAAFDELARDYRAVVERLAAMGEPVDFDPYDEIVTRNLHGVDLNAESVEITRLALWLKTARRHHRLQHLEATIKAGNSLIDDPQYTDRPFDWRAAFPDVFAEGGFDVAIGNPPYVRMELIKPVKPYLEKHYRVAADRADLYAYFFERGLALLKPGGRLGYISSSTFFRTGSGEKLRLLLSEEATIEAVVDFGDLQVFEGVTTYPAIVTMRKAEGGTDGELAFLKADRELPKDLSAAFDADATTMRRKWLTAGPWCFEEDLLARLRAKIVSGRKTLGEIYGAPLYGIKTGLNKAFVIDTETRNRLVAADPRSEEPLRPFLRGEDVKRWRVEPQGLFLINTPKGKVAIDDYPAVRDWLLPFRPALETRATKQEWFELQQAQLAYQPKLAEPKIVWPHFQSAPSFTLDREGLFLNNKCFFLPVDDGALLALLNSSYAWFLLLCLARIKRGGYLEAEAQYVERIVLPDMDADQQQHLSQLSESGSGAANRRFELQSAVRRRILDLAPPGRRLTRRLEEWWALGFAAFRAEARRAFRADVPVAERAEWEAYLAESAAEVNRLTGAIAEAEAEIDAIVYRLFELTDDEIRLLEDTVAGRG